MTTSRFPSLSILGLAAALGLAVCGTAGGHVHGPTDTVSEGTWLNDGEDHAGGAWGYLFSSSPIPPSGCSRLAPMSHRDDLLLGYNPAAADGATGTEDRAQAAWVSQPGLGRRV